MDPVRLALLYLAALAGAELLTALVEPRVGLVLHALLLVSLLLHAGLTWGQPLHRLLLALVFAPIIRLVSMSMPLAGFPLVYWYLITSLPLFVAAVIMANLLRLDRAGIGISLRAFPVQLLVGITGLAFGYIEYQILRPKPLAQAFTWQDLWLPALILLVSTGFVEELIFRGVMQRVAVETVGRWKGFLYVAALFAVLHVGYLSVLDVLFVFGVALFFGWATLETGSIVGVTLAHGLTNIVLFLIVPLWLGPGQGGVKIPGVGAALPASWIFLGPAALATVLLGLIWGLRRRK
jgi:membrane protease YdiL (CAAX protease family)